MKLRNKKTGEMAELCSKQQIYEDKAHLFLDTKNGRQYYASLAELNEEWEDYEEPKEHWAIDQFGEPINVSGLSKLQLEKLHRLGNDFPSENATIKAIEKLKAWKRLNKCGFRFVEWQQHGITEDGILDGAIYFENAKNVNREDLDLLFGGEE